MPHQHPEDEPRVDLSALDPDRDPGAADRFEAAVMARLAARPVPQALPADPLIGIWSMMRGPALAAGIIIAVAVGAMSLRLNRDPGEPQTIAQAIGVPAEFLAAAPPVAPVDSR